MNPMLLQLLSGPAMALARYAITAGATYVAQKQWVDGNTISAAVLALTGFASAGIGALTSTTRAKLITTAGITGAAVTFPNGAKASTAQEAAAITQRDPTWSDPNAR